MDSTKYNLVYEYLIDVLGDLETAEYLVKTIALGCVIKQTNILCFYGKGNNGKSVLSNMIRNLSFTNKWTTHYCVPGFALNDYSGNTIIESNTLLFLNDTFKNSVAIIEFGKTYISQQILNYDEIVIQFNNLIKENVEEMEKLIELKLPINITVPRKVLLY